MPARMQKNGFTLVELLIVIVIIAVLASIALPVFNGIQERAKATQDMSNLRQIGLATQMYLNDNDGTFFLPTDNWMKDLNPKYLSTWKIFQSPFDNKRTSSEDSTNAPVSYGFNINAKTASGGSLSSDKITDVTRFILFAPKQNSNAAAPFAGTAGTAGFTVSKDDAGPNGASAGGTHSRGSRLNGCMADLHVENMTWNDFHSDSPENASYTKSARWHPDPVSGNP